MCIKFLKWDNFPPKKKLPDAIGGSVFLYGKVFHVRYSIE
jgi:hypothetical protein